MFAAKVFGVLPAQVTAEQRIIGKTSILGLGFGLGWIKFKHQVRVKSLEAMKLSGVGHELILDDADSVKIVKTTGTPTPVCSKRGEHSMQRSQYWLVTTAVFLLALVYSVRAVSPSQTVYICTTTTYDKQQTDGSTIMRENLGGFTVVHSSKISCKRSLDASLWMPLSG